MIPLALPEPAAAPPAHPASVSAPNQPAGAAADHGRFAALIDAGNGGAATRRPRNAAAPAAAIDAIKQMHARGGNWVVSALASAVHVPAADATVPSAPSSGSSTVSNASDEDGAEAPADLPLDTTTADVSMLCGDSPTSAQAAFRIPVPGDEDADQAESGSSSDSSKTRRINAGVGVSALLQAAGREGVDAAVETSPGDEGGQSAATEGVAASAEKGAEADPIERPMNLTRAAAATAASPPISNDTERTSNGGAVGEVERHGNALDVAGAQQASSMSDRAAAEEPAANARRAQGVSATKSEPRSARAVSHADTPHGSQVRSAVASAATTSDKPADAVHAVIDAGLASATPAQSARDANHDTPAVRPSSSDGPSRRVDAPSFGLAFSSDGDPGESGNREEDGHSRQGSAMSARLAAAVASTSEAPSPHAASASPVFAVPTIQPSSSPVVTSSVDAQSAAPTLPAENVERLVQAMHVNVKSGVMEATVRLRPEYLGEVTIQLRVDGSSVTAVVQTDTPAVRQWLESQEQTIRNGLAAHGLDLDRLVVNPDGERQQPRDESEANESRRRAYRRRQPSTERFEITV